MKRQEIKRQLKEMEEPEYQMFSSKLLPGVTDIQGVRLGKLRKLAALIAKEDWHNYVEYPEFETFEEKMLYGMVIGKLSTDFNRHLELVTGFVPFIDNWSVCDSFCSSLKFTRNHREQMWSFLQPYSKSHEEYAARFAAVMFLDYFVNEEYIQRVLECYTTMKQEGYYARMAVAWGISVCYANFQDITMQYMEKIRTDPFVYQKALQKIIESNRVSKEEKKIIKKLREENQVQGKNNSCKNYQ